MNKTGETNESLQTIATVILTAIAVPTSCQHGSHTFSSGSDRGVRAPRGLLSNGYNDDLWILGQIGLYAMYILVWREYFAQITFNCRTLVGSMEIINRFVNGDLFPAELKRTKNDAFVRG